MTGSAIRDLLYSALLKAQFTFRTWHGAPLHRAVRVWNSSCFSVWSRSSACLSSTVCVCAREPALLGGAMARNQRYIGPALFSAGLALYRAPSVSRDCTGTKADTWHYSTGAKKGPVLLYSRGR
ncbi:unnamed protein product [Ectocarpus sp. 12 AP-2014]